MGSNITDLGSGNEKIALFGGINADNLQICSTDPNIPEMIIYAPSAGQTIPLQVTTKAGYSATTTIDQDN